MPQSLMLTTPPAPVPFKRQRSYAYESQTSQGAQTQSATAFAANRELEKRPIVRMPGYLSKSKSEILNLFQELEWKQRFRLSHGIHNPETSPYRLNRSVTAMSRNRYTNVQPWETSRIKLKFPIGGSDYVNASPITLKRRSLISSYPGSSSTFAAPEQTPDTTSTKAEHKYIATQGPKDGQFSHFWHMVMQETVGPVGVIVMLTQLYEGNKEKCSQYFPQNMENPTILLPSHEDELDVETAAPTISAGVSDDGDPFWSPKSLSAVTDTFSVTATASNSKSLDDLDSKTSIPAPTQPTEPDALTSPDAISLLSLTSDPEIGPQTACEVRHLRLTINNVSKEIYHYLYTGWPDYGKPEDEDRGVLLNLLRVSREKAGGGESGNPNPRFVHCSAGVGRTGTFIALDSLVGECEAGGLVVSPPGVKEKAQVSRTAASQVQTTYSQSAQGPGESWGRSGPPKQQHSHGFDKESTPEPSSNNQTDLVFETVNQLREQRMMMVMTELQFAFIYEVLRKVFANMYADKTSGVAIRGGGVVEPMAKVARLEGGATTDASTVAVGKDGDWDCSVSDAETELLDGDTTAPDQAAVAHGGNEADPYSAVAPETFLRADTETVT